MCAKLEIIKVSVGPYKIYKSDTRNEFECELNSFKRMNVKSRLNRFRKSFNDFDAI